MIDFIKSTGFKSNIYKRVEKNYGITDENIKRFGLVIRDPKVLIYQLHWLDSQVKLLDPNFIPLRNFEPDRTKNPYQENNDILQIYYNLDWQSANLIGSVSWRFKEKTGLNYEAIIKQIEPDCQIYSMSPKKYHKPEHHYQNNRYEGMLDICKFVDSKNILPVKTFQFNKVQSYCNYWLLSPEYFKEYIENYLMPVIDLFKYNAEAHKYLRYKMDHRGDKYNTVVFFLEGLFSTFIADKKFKHII